MTTDSERLAELAVLRRQSEMLDAELVSALDRRAELAQRIHAASEAAGQWAADGDEAAWLERLSASAKHISAEALRPVLRAARAAMRGLEEPARVAFVGPELGHCHQMVRSHFGAGATLLECPTISDALDAVGRKRAAYAVVPFESSEEGIAQPTVIALAQSELFLVAERTLPVSFDLVSLGHGQAKVEQVLASPAALEACQQLARRRFPSAAVIEVASPREALERTRNEPGSVALVPGGALDEMDDETRLRLRSESNVGDVPEAFVRFAVAAPRPARRAERNRTCLVFGVQDRPGSLFEVLRHFAERGLNLGKVQSRPIAQAEHLSGPGWDYVFYAEVEGHETDRAMVTALDNVKRSAKFLRVLGSFPVEPVG
jgi:chorismate mutase/prephenate dehydratase